MYTSHERASVTLSPRLCEIMLNSIPVFLSFVPIILLQCPYYSQKMLMILPIISYSYCNITDGCKCRAMKKNPVVPDN